ncbi:MAG: hypothetical protein VX438_14015 [Planctomycetota bacterium]|nr:hypothetical protein [Planctomycetota bacterium]
MFQMVYGWLVWLIPALRDWFVKNPELGTGRSFTAVDAGKGLAALAAILFLALGAVLVISLSGRWVRRWIYKREGDLTGKTGSLDAEFGKLDWAKHPADDASPIQNE